MYWFIGIIIALVVVEVVYWLILRTKCTIPLRADEIHTVLTKDLWQLSLYRVKPASGVGEPVLLAHGLLCNHWFFSLPKGDSMVDALSKAGYDCWLIDWRGDRSCIPPYGQKRNNAMLDDTLAYDVPAVLKTIQEKTGFDKVHWVGHSLGGMLLYAHLVANGGDKHIASATTLGSPPGFAGIEFRLPAVLLAMLRWVPWKVNWLLRGATPFMRLFKLKFKFAPINWDNTHPGIDTCALYNLLEQSSYPYVKELAFWASNGIWHMQNDTLNVTNGLAEIDVPLFAIYGRIDPFVSLDTAEAFVRSLATNDKQLMIASKEDGFQNDYNHADLVLGIECADEIFPPIIDWLDDHAIGKKPVRKVVEETSELPPESEPQPDAVLAGDSLDIDTEDELAALAPRKPVKPKVTPKPKKKRAVKAKPAAKKKTAVKKKAAVKKKTEAKRKPSSRK